MSLFRKPFFWFLFIFIAIGCILFNIKFFPEAFPIVNINLSMNRQQASMQAANITKQLQLGPTTYQHAISFSTDELAKTFVELEGGGKDTFIEMIEQNLYQPYTWQIRHFKPSEINEVLIKFTPDGIPYGFLEKIPEDTQGPHLTTQEAKTIAQQIASDNWNMNFDFYKQIEVSKEIKINGRADYTFVFERPEKLNDAFYRLRIIVRGDKVTEVTPYLHVPDAFKRRYKEMRTANDTIAWIAQILILILYIFGGCIIGLLILLRKHYVLWRTPIICSFIIALLLAFSRINQFPLQWMQYNTAYGFYSFVTQQIISILFGFLYNFILLTIVFMAAESLTRKAFGSHVLLWQVWSMESASSLTILGNTISAYLVTILDSSYIIIFYLLTTYYLGWWIPSTMLFNPNILATYIPWFSPIITALNAGFMEECLFRAVPLASAALIGDRFGKRNLFIACAFILQAFIFGAAHANYPMQPAYARLIELIIPSFVFGGLYLRFGLLTAILTHIIYDIFWMTLPIFVSHAPGSGLNQIIVVLCTSIPLLVVVWGRLKYGKWNELTEKLYNSSWQPKIPDQSPIKKMIVPQFISLSKEKKYIIIISGFLGLIGWFLFSNFTNYAPKLSVNREQAIAIAYDYLNKKEITLSNQWQPLTCIKTEDGNSLQDRFIWQVADKKQYQQLIGSYLMPPCWLVRFVQFNGDIIQRAEEYHVYIKQDGTVFRFNHKLPESQSGNNLSKKDARIIAEQAIASQYNLNINQLKEISAITKKQPSRTDWCFTYVNSDISIPQNGQARIAIEISGNQVTDSCQFIHMPENWKRAEQNEQLLSQIIKQVCGLFVYLLFIIGTVIGLLHLSQFNATNNTITTKLFIFFLSFFTLHLVNILPRMIAQFNTSQPFTSQLFMILGALGIGTFIKAATFAFSISFITQWKTMYTLGKNIYASLIGISIGTIFATIQLSVSKVIPPVKPFWAQYSQLDTYFPIFDTLYNTLLLYLVLSVLVLMLFSLVDYGTHHWTKNKTRFSFLIIVFGVLLTGLQIADNLVLFSVSGLLLGIYLLCTYHFIVRFDHALIPLATAGYVIIHITRQVAANAYPFASIHYIVSGIVILVCGLIWYKQINNKEMSYDT